LVSRVRKMSSPLEKPNAVRPQHRHRRAAAADQDKLPFMVMQVSLEAMELWDVVEAASKDRVKDQRALATIV
jgi:hypothetical protein